MPPFVPLVDGAQVEIIQQIGGKNIENRLWFIDRSPPITTAHLQSLATGVAIWFANDLLPMLSTELTALLTTATRWDRFAGDVFENQIIADVGTNTSGVHSANVAIRVRFKGDSSQRFPDNSNFVSGIPKSEVDGNLIVPTFASGIRNAYIDLIDLAAGFGTFPAWRWVITSRQLDYAPRTTQAHARTDFITVPSPYVSPRRRRLPRPI